MKVEKNISDNKWEGTPDDCDQLKLSRKMEAYHQDRNHQHCLCMYNRCKKTREEEKERIRSIGQKMKKKKKDQGTRDRCKKKKDEKKNTKQGTKKEEKEKRPRDKRQIQKTK